MKRISVLNIADKEDKVRNLVKYEDYETHTLITARNSARAIKRIIKRNKDEIIIINGKSKDKPLLREYIKTYNELSMEAVLEVIEKICRQVALKHKINLPFEDVCLYASPETAYEYIKRLIGLSRIFTVVTDKPAEEMADRLYFEYGCLIRHSAKPKLYVEDSVSVFIEECGLANSPIINVTNNEILGEKVTDARKISVRDSKIIDLSKTISGVSGLSLYNLIGELPEENSVVDINKNSDTIFLLDTKAF